MFEQSKLPKDHVFNQNNRVQKKSKVNFEAQQQELQDSMNGIHPWQLFAEEEEEERKQLKSDSAEGKTHGEELEKENDPVSEGTKTQMPEDIQSQMEDSFETSFSNVNIHKDSDQATNLGALAYAQGNDIHFAPGQYEPGSQKGQELLGHELTHVVQQREGRVKPDTEQPAFAKATAGNINSDTTLEKEADEMGAKAAQGKMADVRGCGDGMQKKGEEKEKWTITRYVSPGHKGGYQHIFDEKGRLIILTPVHGPHTFNVTTTPENFVDKGDGASVGVGEIKQVSIQDVFYGLYMFYHTRPELEHPFVNHIYKYNKENGYDYVQYRSIKGVNQAHKDFFNNGGWMMFAAMLSPLIIEAIPLLIQSSPHLITKIPKSWLVSSLKSKAGQYFLTKTGENVLDSIISYLFTDDVDLTSIGLNYVPTMGKTAKVKLIFLGMKSITDALVDFQFSEKKLRTIVNGKHIEDAAIDLTTSFLGNTSNEIVDEEFIKQIVPKFILRSMSGTLFTGGGEGFKQGINKENEPSHD